MIYLSTRQETFDTTGQTVDEEVESIGVSYTSGGVTLAANSYSAEVLAHSWCSW